MQDVWQSYSDHESKDHKIQEQPNAQLRSFTITRAKTEYKVIVTGTFFTLFGLIFLVGHFVPSMSGQLLVPFTLTFVMLVIAILYIPKPFRVQQIIELFDDKIIIKDVDEGIIEFSNIREYGISYNRGYTSLTIKLNLGPTKKIYGRDAEMTSLTVAFDSEIQQAIREKHFSIKKSPDRWFLFFAIALALILIIFLLNVLHLI